MTATTLDLPELPELTCATDKQLRYWLGHAQQHKSDSALPRGLTATRGKYVVRVQMAGDQVRCGTYEDQAVATHVAAVVQRRWLEALQAEIKRRGAQVKVKIRSTVPLPDVQELSDEDLLLAAKQIRSGSMTLEPYRGGPRHKSMIPWGRGRMYLGFAESKDDAEAMARDMQDRLWPLIQAELRKRLQQLRKERAERENERLKEDPYAE